MEKHMTRHPKPLTEREEKAELMLAYASDAQCIAGNLHHLAYLPADENPSWWDYEVHIYCNLVALLCGCGIPHHQARMYAHSFIRRVVR
jgi:hypothetical protein